MHRGLAHALASIDRQWQPASGRLASGVPRVMARPRVHSFYVSGLLPTHALRSAKPKIPAMIRMAIAPAVHTPVTAAASHLLPKVLFLGSSRGRILDLSY